MNDAKLKEKRDQEEKGLVEVDSFPLDEWTYLCVLRNKDNIRDMKPPYHCYRYFTVAGGEIHVSRDEQRVDMKRCLMWYRQQLGKVVSVLEDRLDDLESHGWERDLQS